MTMVASMVCHAADYFVSISDRGESLDQDEEYLKLQEEYAALLLEEEELLYIGKFSN